MDAIYLLIPLTLVLLAIAIGIFFWAVNTDQYSDLDKEASRILFEEKGFEEKKFEEKGSKENQPEESNEKETDSEQSSRTSHNQSGQKQ
ncbi:cbb3-type cytochrome oxidase assembly protein CcoS [Kangiella sp.]|uniref:cbb3-type cytochrome oxidase assembly protein CcoS n=1 Tax=Kangiella sp. TaxID=1920245 RepID=UPI003A94796B